MKLTYLLQNKWPRWIQRQVIKFVLKLVEWNILNWTPLALSDSSHFLHDFCTTIVRELFIKFTEFSRRSKLTAICYFNIRLSKRKRGALLTLPQ